MIAQDHVTTLSGQVTLSDQGTLARTSFLTWHTQIPALNKKKKVGTTATSISSAADQYTSTNHFITKESEKERNTVHDWGNIRHLGVGQSSLLRKAGEWYTASDSDAQRKCLDLDISVLRKREMLNIPYAPSKVLLGSLQFLSIFLRWLLTKTSSFHGPNSPFSLKDRSRLWTDTMKEGRNIAVLTFLTRKNASVWLITEQTVIKTS